MEMARDVDLPEEPPHRRRHGPRKAREEARLEEILPRREVHPERVLDPHRAPVEERRADERHVRLAPVRDREDRPRPHLELLGRDRSHAKRRVRVDPHSGCDCVVEATHRAGSMAGCRASRSETCTHLHAPRRRRERPRPRRLRGHAGRRRLLVLPLPVRPRLGGQAERRRARLRRPRRARRGERERPCRRLVRGHEAAGRGEAGSSSPSCETSPRTSRPPTPRPAPLRSSSSTPTAGSSTSGAPDSDYPDRTRGRAVSPPGARRGAGGRAARRPGDAARRLHHQVAVLTAKYQPISNVIA